jgi:hypothetical protein
MMVGVGGERSRMSTLRSIGVGVVILLAGLVVTAIAYRQSIAEALLMRELHDLGLESAAFSITRFDAGVLELENLKIADRDGLEIARIEAHFSARGLFASRLDALKISGTRLRGTLDEAGLSFGPLDRMLERNAASADSEVPAALPASGIEIDDAQLELTTAQGPLRAELELRAVETAPETLEAKAQLQVRHALGNLDARLSATGSPSSLTGVSQIGASAAAEFGDISARAVSLAATADFAFEGGDIAIQPVDCVKIRIEDLALESLLAFSKPLDLCVRSASEPAIRISREGGVETGFEIAAAKFAAELRTGAKPQRVSGELPTLRMSSTRRDGGFAALLETEAGRLEFDEHAVTVRGIQLEANASRDAEFPSGQLRIAEIYDTRRVARFPKLALNARFEPRDRNVDFEVELANADRDLVVEVNGVHQLAEAAGRADLHLHAIDFEPGQLQPSALFPVLSGVLTEASGSIEMKGAVGWNDDGMRGTAEVAITDVSATSELATVEHLNAVVELNETGGTLLEQTVSIGRLDFGLELTDGLIRYRVKPGGAVAIDSVNWKFAGGEITSAGEIDLQSEKREASLVVKGVDLTQLIEIIDLEGLSGSGTLEGELPLALVGDEIQIRNAVLRSTGEAGVIRYRPDPGTSNIAAVDRHFATALTILEDFRYERLEIEIDGSATEAVVIEVHFAGVNPNYQEGHPVEFNLSVDARLSDLLRTGMRVYRMPKKIEERLRAFAEKSL